MTSHPPDHDDPRPDDGTAPAAEPDPAWPDDEPGRTGMRGEDPYDEAADGDADPPGHTGIRGEDPY